MSNEGSMAAPDDPLDDEQDPTEDTPDPDAEDTADEADDAAEPEWEPKSKIEAQRKISEQGREIARLRALSAGADDADSDDADDDDSDDDDEDDEEQPDTSPRLEAESWELAKSAYGDDAVSAYRVVRRLGALGVMPGSTPMDAITSLMAFHERMTNGAKPPAKAAGAKNGQSRDAALQPHVDTNRSDGPDSNEAALAEARKSKSPDRFDKFAGAAAAALGFGPPKRRG